MRLKLTIAGSLLGKAVGLGFFDDAESVKLLSDKKAVEAEVLGSFQPAMVGVFSENPEECPNCEGLAKEFKKAAANLAGYGVESFAVDCTGALPKCHGFTQQLQVRNLPAVAVFAADPKPNPYTRKAARELIPFEGNARASAVAKFVLGALPAPAALLPRLEDGSAWPPALPIVGTSLVVLFTDRDAPSPLYKALAHHYRGRLSFAEAADLDTKELQAKFAVEQFPTLLVTLIDAAKQDADLGAVFKGDLKSWQDITGFLDAHALPEDALTAPKGAAAAAAAAKGSDGAGRSKAGQGSGSQAGGALKPGVGGAGALRLATSGDVDVKVAKSREAWLVLYHALPADDGVAGAPTDKEAAAAGAWAEAVHKCGTNGLLRAAEVNCTATPDLCGKDVLSFFAKKASKTGAKAAIKVFPYGVDEKAEADDVMGGGLGSLEAAEDAMDAYAAAAESLPDLTYKVNGYTMEQVMVEAVKSGGMVLVLFSAKAEPPVMLKQLALTLEGAVSVAFFPEPDEQSMAKFQVRKPPAFVAIFQQPDDPNAPAQKDARGQGKRPDEVAFGIRPYDPHMFGKPSLEAVLAFSLSMVQQLSPDLYQTVLAREQQRLEGLFGNGPDSSLADGSPGASGGSKAVEVAQVADAAAWAALCPPTSAQLCAVAFLSARPGTPTFDAELAVAQAAAAARTKDPYTFVWVDGQCWTEFADAFDVQPSKLPSMVAYSPKRNRYAGFVGVYGVEAVGDLLTGVLSGRVKTHTLYQPAVPDANKDCAALHASGALGNAQADADADAAAAAADADDDMGDLMAEILAEEARAKAVLEAELAAEQAAAKQAAADEAAAAAKAAAAKAKKKKKKKAAAKKKSKKDNEL